MKHKKIYQGRQPEFISYLLVAIDLTLINIIALKLCASLNYINTAQQVALFTVNLSWLLAARLSEAYHIKNLLHLGEVMNTMIKTTLIHMAGINFIYCFWGPGPFPRIIFTAYIILAFVILSLSRFLFSRYLRRISANGYRFKSALIVGMGMEAQKIKNFFYSGQSFGVNFMGYIAGKNEEGSLQSSESRYKDRAKVIGGVDELPYWIKQGRVEEIYWSLPEAEDYHIEGIINLCEKYMVRFYRVPHFDNLPFKNFDVNSYSGLPVLHYRKEPLENIFNKFIKRVFDLAFSFLVIVLILSWLTPLVWSIMKFTMPGPVFFAQDRSGKDNKTFKVLKFRSMKVNNSSDKVQATKGDSRITPFGRFLRKSSIDEMPQFINVFLGQMTVTGPRPHMLKHTEEYSEKINTFMVRHLIKPGITGWAQVNGFRGGTENLTQMQGRVEHDVWYLENWNFWLDMRIIVKTIKNTIRGEDNAY